MEEIMSTSSPVKSLRRSLLILPISGFLGAVVLLLRGPYQIPLTGNSDWISLVSSQTFLTYQILLIFLYVLPFIGFIALHEHLQGSENLRIYSLGGLILSLWGTSLALPASGIATFIAALAANPSAADPASIGQIVTKAITGPGSMVGISAAVCYTLGPVLFGIAIWRKTDLSRTAAVLFALHGALLSFGFSYFPALIAGWISLAISGTILSFNLRK
jgi:hypothetical protein